MKFTMKIMALLTGISAVFPCFAQTGKSSFCDEYLRNVRKTEKITGMSIAIEQHGKTMYKFVEGEPDKKKEPFTAETPLQVASITNLTS